MKREALIAGLDIGSTKTCAVIGEVDATSRTGAAKILGVGIARTTGVRRGVVRDIEVCTAALRLRTCAPN